MVRGVQSAAAGFTVSADLIRGLIECAVRCGLPRGRFADMLVDEGGPSAPSRYAGEHILKLWDRVLRLSGDPIIGFRMALVAGLKTFGVLGQIAPRCANVWDAFKQTERYASLASQAAHILVARDGRVLALSLTLDVPSGLLRDNIVLWGLTNWSLLPARLTGTAVRPKAITCASPAPGSAELRVLGRHCKFAFDARHNRVLFDRSVSDLAIASADPDLKKLLAEVMEQHLAALGPAASFEQGLMALLREMMNGTMPTLASLSARAGMSPRTLQRRLTTAKSSFQALLQQVLQERAEELLARGNLSQGEIAFLLGYSEVSAFSRAYRGWTGRSPGAAFA